MLKLNSTLNTCFNFNYHPIPRNICEYFTLNEIKKVKILHCSNKTLDFLMLICIVNKTISSSKLQIITVILK